MRGKRFGRLLVLEEAGKECQRRQFQWRCVCDCGKKLIADGCRLRSGTTTSCGCYMRYINSKLMRIRGIKHGMARHPVNKVWRQMLARCENPKDKAFKHYGGRGIRVCRRWHNFKHFMADMGERPSDKQIERINNDGDYCPNNCRWATAKEQQRNRSNNRIIEWNNQRKPLVQWAEELGVNRCLLRNRLAANWTIEKAFTTPTRRGRGSD